MLSLRKLFGLRAAAVAAFAFLFFAAPAAHANPFSTTFTLGGSSLMGFAGAAGTPSGVWNVDVDGTELTFTNVFLPNLEPGGEEFSFTLPGNSFTATWDPNTNSVISNPISLTIDNLDSSLVGTHELILTTGADNYGTCNGTTDIAGQVGSLTGGTSMMLIASDCVGAGSPPGLGSDATFRQILQLRLAGTFGQPLVVPEPTALALLLIGAGGVLVARRRQDAA